jgi:DNA-binding IclR family transcriptional regulator
VPLTDIKRKKEVARGHQTPAIQSLDMVTHTNETEHLAVREGRHALFIDHVSTNQQVGVAGQTLRRRPIRAQDGVIGSLGISAPSTRFPMSATAFAPGR